MVKLSKRLSHLADMVSENSILADVGTDHGYIPVCLVQTNKIAKAFATVSYTHLDVYKRQTVHHI